MDEVVEVWGERGKGMDKVRQGDVVTGKHLADVEGTRGCWNWSHKEGNEWESRRCEKPWKETLIFEKELHHSRP